MIASVYLFQLRGEFPCLAAQKVAAQGKYEEITELMMSRNEQITTKHMEKEEVKSDKRGTRNKGANHGTLPSGF